MPATKEWEARQGWFVRWYTRTPTPFWLAVSAAQFYMGLFLHTVVVIISCMDREWALFWQTSVAIVLPGIVQGLNTFVITRLMHPETPLKTRAVEAAYHILCLGRGVEAYRYLKGSPPLSWSAVCKDRLGTIALCDVPAVMANLNQLLRKDLRPDLLTLSLASSTLFMIFSVPNRVKICHSMTGLPGSCEKYRYWELLERPLLNTGIVFLLDASQVIYRMLLFALLAKFVGVFYVLLFIFAYQVVAFRFLQLGLNAIPFVKNPATLAFTAAIEVVVFDYVWLEPCPPYKCYVENCYVLRVLQAVIGASIMVANWEKHSEGNQRLFWFLFICCVSSAFLYFIVYAIFVYYYSRERVRAAYDAVDEFLAKMAQLKVEKNNERKSGPVIADGEQMDKTESLPLQHWASVMEKSGSTYVAADGLSLFLPRGSFTSEIDNSASPPQCADSEPGLIDHPSVAEPLSPRPPVTIVPVADAIGSTISDGQTSDDELSSAPAASEQRGSAGSQELGEPESLRSRAVSASSSRRPESLWTRAVSASSSMRPSCGVTSSGESESLGEGVRRPKSKCDIFEHCELSC